MASSVEQIKAKLGIVDVVSSYLKLERAGLNYRACCPFHNEKSPSFFVSPSRNSYHCFGCQRGGDIFSFVQEIEGVDFLESLKILAERAGVDLEPLSRAPKTDNRLIAILEETANFYFKNLVSQSQVLEYLFSRGLEKEVIRSWRLGFAPSDWRNLADYLLGRGYREEELVKAGLVIKQVGTGGPGRAYDRFRSRIMFPLFNPSGKVVGFSGRIFLASPLAGGQQSEVAKYINSPQTEVYDKSKILYGYDRAKQAIRQAGICIFVEGQMDLLMSHQAGVENVVAVSGTALTIEQINLVKRLADQVILAYDYDLAGLKASHRAIDLLRQEELNVKIAKLPSGEDPAELIKADPALWVKAITEAKHYIDFMIDACLEEGKKGLDLNLAVNQNVLPYLKSLDKKMEQAHFVAKIANLLQISEEAVWSDLAKIRLESENSNAPALPKEAVAPAQSSPLLVIEERLWGLYFLLQDKEDDLESVPGLSELLKVENFVTKEKDYQVKRERLAFAAELLFADKAQRLVEFESLASRWRELNLKEELTQTLKLVHKAEAQGETAQLADLLKKCQDLSSAINSLKK